MYLHAELVHTRSNRCFSVAVYLNIKMTKINSRYPALLKRLREKVSYLRIKVQGCESAVCNSNQQREMLRKEMSSEFRGLYSQKVTILHSILPLSRPTTVCLNSSQVICPQVPQMEHNA